MPRPIAAAYDHAHRRPHRLPPGDQAPPSSYLKKLYFDTIVFTHHQLDYLTELYGSDHILLGTDYPYDMALPNAVRFVESAKLTRADKDVDSRRQRRAAAEDQIAEIGCGTCETRPAQNQTEGQAEAETQA